MSEVTHVCGGSEGCMCMYDPDLNPGLKAERYVPESQVADLRAEVERLRDAIDVALPALEGYLQGESGLPFTDPYRATRTAAEALRAASRPCEESEKR